MAVENITQTETEKMFTRGIKKRIKGPVRVCEREKRKKAGSKGETALKEARTGR